jgi:DNA repair protein RecO (recombination protein O)
VRATWRARLPEQLGTFSGELQEACAALLLEHADRLAALGAACPLLEATLPERDPHPLLYNGLNGLISVLQERDDWPEHYVRFELALLAELGFGLDLAACAVTGAAADLAYVSPRTGRAVGRAAAGAYAARLLPLPAFLTGAGAADPAQIAAGLKLTGAFLQRHLFDAAERPMPGARERLLRRLARSSVM